MKPGDVARLATVAVLVIAGCSTGPRTPCPPPTGKAASELEQDYMARRTAADAPPAELRTPDDKGPSPEGVEAIALLGSEIMNSRRESCEEQSLQSHPQSP